jgi:hypothetical protein
MFLYPYIMNAAHVIGLFTGGLRFGGAAFI